MIVHRILDVVFRTLDTVDAVRAKVGTLLGQDPRPPSEWPPVVEDTRPAPAPGGTRANKGSDGSRGTSVDDIRNTYTEAPDLDGYSAKDEDGAASQPAKQAKKATKKATKKASKTAASTKPKPVKKKAAASTTTPKESKEAKDANANAKAGSHRKGSVDRKGVDFDSPRARAVEAWLRDHHHPVVAEEAALDGKKTLARVLWAVGAADAAGSEHGLTAADASALLSSSAQLDVFATNVARAFRDESALFDETVPDGRSKRYKLTAAGRARLDEVATTVSTSTSTSTPTATSGR